MFFLAEEEQKTTIGTMFWILVILAIGALTVLFFLSDTIQGISATIVNFITNFTDPLLIGLVFFGIMVVQSIAVPIPSEGVLIVGGLAFYTYYDGIGGNIWVGFTLASLIGYAGSIVGAIMLFYLGRKGGRPLVIKLLGKSNMNFVDNWFQRWGVWAVGLGRLLPVIFYDPISLVGGATDMGFKHYIYGTLVGTVPRVLFYCGIGAILGVSNVPAITENLFTIILVIVICIGLILLFIYWLMFRRYAKEQKVKKEEEIA